MGDSLLLSQEVGGTTELRKVAFDVMLLACKVPWLYFHIYCLRQCFYCCDKDHSQKQLGEARVCFIFQTLRLFPITERSQDEPLSGN